MERKRGAKSASLLRESSSDLAKIVGDNDILKDILKRDKNDKLVYQKKDINTQLFIHGFDKHIVVNAINLQDYNYKQIVGIVEDFKDYIEEVGFNGLLEFHANDTTQNSYHFHFHTSHSDDNVKSTLEQWLVFNNYADSDNVDIHGKYKSMNEEIKKHDEHTQSGRDEIKKIKDITKEKNKNLNSAKDIIQSKDKHDSDYEDEEEEIKPPKNKELENERRSEKWHKVRTRRRDIYKPFNRKYGKRQEQDNGSPSSKSIHNLRSLSEVELVSNQVKTSMLLQLNEHIELQSGRRDYQRVRWSDVGNISDGGRVRDGSDGGRVEVEQEKDNEMFFFNYSNDEEEVASANAKEQDEEDEMFNFKYKKTTLIKKQSSLSSIKVTQEEVIELDTTKIQYDIKKLSIELNLDEKIKELKERRNSLAKELTHSYTSTKGKSH